MVFSRQEYCSGLPFPTPGGLPDPDINPPSPPLAGSIFFNCWATQEAHLYLKAVTTFSLGKRLGNNQFSSAIQLYPTLCDPMDCSRSDLPVHHQLSEFTQTHVYWVGDAIQPSHPLLSLSPPAPQSFPASGSFQMSQLFASGGQSIGVSASLSVLPMNTQDWSLLRGTGWISLLSKGLSRVFSNTTVQKHQFFSAQLFLYSNSYIHTWLLEEM